MLGFYTGSYTTKLSSDMNAQGLGICCYQIDERNKQAKLISVAEQRNPSYLVISDNGRFLYAVEELFQKDDPKVYSYEIGKNGQLMKINCQPLKGEFACHITIINHHLLISNYGSGDVQIFPLSIDGSILPSRTSIELSGHGVNKNRQLSPHAHMALDSGKGYFWVADLGTDCCKAFRFKDGSVASYPQNDLYCKAGSGPRHMVCDVMFSRVYVLCELSGDIYVFDVSTASPKLISVHNSLIKKDRPKGDFSSAAIKMSIDNRFIYVSNRQPSVITIFERDSDGSLEIKSSCKIDQKTPRDLALNSTGNIMLIAGQDSRSIGVHRVDMRDGNINCEQNVAQQSVSCVTFFTHL